MRCDAYFQQRRAPKWIYFSFFLHCNIPQMCIFRSPYLHAGGRWTYALTDFFVQNSIPRHFFQFFFDAMFIFGIVEPQCESTFPFFYIVIFQRWVSFKPPCSTLVGDRHMRSRTFLYEIQLRTTFIRGSFWCDAYFWQCSAINAKIRAFSINHNVNSSANDRGTIFYDKLF